MRRRHGKVGRGFLVAACTILVSLPASAQLAPAAASTDSSHAIRNPLVIGAAVAAALVASVAGDVRLRAFAEAHQQRTLDRVADAVDPLGRAGTLVPALAAAALLPRVFGNRALADAGTRIALSYAAADIVESILKPAIGRHRPSDGGGPWRFRPFVNDADWHSLPSAHTTHTFALATALALESRTSVVSVPAYALATLVAAERVYRNEHWTSDVVASAILATAISRAADMALRRRAIPRLLPRH